MLIGRRTPVAVSLSYNDLSWASVGTTQPRFPPMFSSEQNLSASSLIPRTPLEEIVHEVQGKVIKAAQELQQELAGSAEKRALDASTTAADEAYTQDQRAVAKPKAAKRQSKRTACTASGSFETPASKRKDGRLAQESFAASAQEPSELVDPGAASSGSAAQQRCRRISKLQQELVTVALPEYSRYQDDPTRTALR